MPKMFSIYLRDTALVARRLKYKPFGGDFPRVPYPKTNQFLRLAEFGKEPKHSLVKASRNYPYHQVSVSGDNTVDSFKHIDLRVYINRSST